MIKPGHVFQPCFDGRRCQGRSGERPGVGHVPGPRVVVGRAHDVGRHQGRPPQHVSFFSAVKMLDYLMWFGWFFFKFAAALVNLLITEFQREKLAPMNF